MTRESLHRSIRFAAVLFIAALAVLTLLTGLQGAPDWGQGLWLEEFHFKEVRFAAGLAYGYWCLRCSIKDGTRRGSWALAFVTWLALPTVAAVMALEVDPRDWNTDTVVWFLGFSWSTAVPLAFIAGLTFSVLAGGIRSAMGRTWVWLRLPKLGKTGLGLVGIGLSWLFLRGFMWQADTWQGRYGALGLDARIVSVGDTLWFNGSDAVAYLNRPHGGKPSVTDVCASCKVHFVHAAGGQIWISTDKGLVWIKDGKPAKPVLTPIAVDLFRDFSRFPVAGDYVWMNTMAEIWRWRLGSSEPPSKLMDSADGVPELFQAGDAVWLSWKQRIDYFGERGGTPPISFQRPGLSPLYGVVFWKGTYWLGSASGVWRWRPGDEAPELAVPHTGELLAMQVFQGYLVVAGHNGLFVHDGVLKEGAKAQRFEVPFTSTGALGPTSYAKLFDAGRVMWVDAADNGLYRLEPAASAGLALKRSALQTHGGMYWFEKTDTDVWMADAGSVARWPLESPDEPTAYPFKGMGARHWTGQTLVIWSLHKQAARWHRGSKEPPSLENLTESMVFVEPGNGHLWFAGLDGIYAWNPTCEARPGRMEVDVGEIEDIASTDQGAWVASDKGLFFVPRPTYPDISCDRNRP